MACSSQKGFEDRSLGRFLDPLPALDSERDWHQTGRDLNAKDDSDSAKAEILEFTVAASEAGARLDKVLADRCADLSRSQLQALTKAGHVSVNGSAVTKPRHPLAAGDQIVVEIPAPESTELRPQDIPLDVLFEDDHVIVLNKPAGLVVHPAAGNPDGTLVNALLFHCDGKLSSIGGDDRPGIVHRLDKETSGCLVAAKSDEAYQSLTGQFAGRETDKAYFCVVQGVPDSASGHIENRIGRHPVNRQRMAVRPEPHGKEAVTDYEVLRSDDKGRWSLIRCVIHTGRTHQIRVHMKETLRCPILGDELYAQVSRQAVKPGRLMLHARNLAFQHPITGERLEFASPIPEAFTPFLPEASAELI